MSGRQLFRKIGNWILLKPLAYLHHCKLYATTHFRISYNDSDKFHKHKPALVISYGLLCLTITLLAITSVLLAHLLIRWLM